VKIGFRFPFLKAYGCEVIDLAHDFYEVDYLPENDRVRYTISPEAGKEVLKRLLKPRNPRTGSKSRPACKRKKQKETKSRCVRTDKVVLKKHIKAGIGSKRSLSYDIIQHLHNTTKL